MIHSRFGSRLTTSGMQGLAISLRRAKVAVLFGDLCTAAPMDLMVLADALDAPLIYACEERLSTLSTESVAFTASQRMEGGWASATVAALEGRFLLVLGVAGAYRRLQHLPDMFALISPLSVSELKPEHMDLVIHTDVQAAVAQLLQCVRERGSNQTASLCAPHARSIAESAPLGLAS